jgi:hypothetical protein
MKINSRKNRDVKFIIYQSLYIFVVCVIALKGANLDLTEVISKEKVVERSYADSLRKLIDSLLALGLVPEIKFDTNQRFTSPEELQQKLAEVQQQLIVFRQNNPQLTVTQTSPTLNTQDPQIQEQQMQEEKKEEIVEEKKADLDFRIAQTFTQHTVNSVSNPSDTPIEIYGGDGSMITSVPAGGSKSFTLSGQSSLTFKRGGVTRTVSTKENEKPKLNLQRLVPAGENVTIRTLQSTVGYRITISDDFPGQLEVNFNGPVTVRQAGTNVYDVTLNFLKSKQAFERYTDSRDSPYSVSFQINVKDKIAGHSLTQTGIFQFGDW